MNGGCVILNGSPHPDGNSMFLARRLASRLGGAVSVVDLHAARIHPCRGCGGCAGTGICGLAEDDFGHIMDLLGAATYVIIASPVHFSGLSAPLTGFISRLQAYWGRKIPGTFQSVAGLVTTGGSEYDGMFLATRKVIGAALKTLGMPLAGVVAVGGTDARAAADNAPALEQVEALADAMRAKLKECGYIR